MGSTNGIKIGRTFPSSIDAFEEGFRYIIKQNSDNRERAKNGNYRCWSYRLVIIS